MGGGEWKNWIKVISLFTFPHICCFSLLILSILSYEARMIHTCVIRKSQSLTFCLSISIRSHDARMIYA